MEIEYIVASYFVEALFIFVALYIFFKNDTKKDKQKIQKLKQHIEKLKSELVEKEELVEKLSSNKSQTTFVSAEIKKREILEDKIEKLYRIIEDTKDIAKDATMMKNSFLSSIRHEIGTPLNSMLVFAQLLYKEVRDKRLRGFANDILSSGSKLLIFLDNMIELSKIKSDSIKIHEDVVNMDDFFRKNIDSFKADIAKKGLELIINIDEDMPKSLMIDSKRVSDIFTNMLSNALNFTTDGYIKVIVSISDINVINNLVDISISVEDSGVGISKENQKRIFEVFETDDDFEYNGRGVELSVNKRLAQLMNGDLEVQSELSKGSTFILKLRGVEVVLSNDESDRSIDFSAIETVDAVILVVDNIKENLELIKNCFLQTDIKVLLFDNPRDAIDMLKTQKVNMIFIDIDMLCIDDCAVSKVIKRVSDALIITLTDKRVKDVPFIDGGVEPVGHLKKPISRVELFKISYKFLDKTKDDICDIEVQKDNDILDSIDVESLKMFLKAQDVILSKLYKEAISTNDLNAIKVFSSSLLELSLKYDIQTMVKYSKLLLDKVDSFEINDINEMLCDYKFKIEEFEGCF